MLKAAWKRKNDNEIETPKEYKERIKRKRTEVWSEKQLHGLFKRETEDLSDVSRNWIKKTGELKKVTQELIFPAQDQALRTNATKARIENPVIHFGKMYHPNAECVVVPMKLCSIFCVVASSLRRQNIKRCMMLLGGSYIGSCARNMVLSEHTPKSVEENDEVKLLWDLTIQTDHEVRHRRPDIVIQKKKVKETIIVDIAVPGDSNITQKESEKYEKYQDLIKRLKGSGNQGQKWW